MKTVKIYTIKPLKWDKMGEWQWQAQSALGAINVCQYVTDDWYWFGFGETAKISYPTAAAAKLAAQQWHDKRIAAALEEVK
jgi:hypothetical protein